MLDRLAGTLLEDGTRVLLLGNGVAELTPGTLTLLRRYFGGPAADGALPGRVRRWVEAQSSRSADGAEAGPHLYHPLEARLGTTSLVLRFVPALAGADAILVSERPATPGEAELRRLGLTGRETQILQLLMTGASDREIAAGLRIAPGTVRKHLDNLYRKLGVRRRSQAVAMALDLIPPVVSTGAGS
jgi:DNA-binding CsgD family transcriptional regulator